MPSEPYLINGTIKDSNGIGIHSKIFFTVNNTSQTVFSNYKGQFVFDLAELTYSQGDEVTYIASDLFNNEINSSSFIVTGTSKTLNLSLSTRNNYLIPPSNRSFQLFNIGGEMVTKENPFPVSLTDLFQGHPDVLANCSVAWTFAFSAPDSRPATETITLAGGTQYQRSFTYDANKRLTNRSLWQKL